MKNLKTNKVQILAALALAFSLGIAMPSAVFASEEGAGEPAVQANDGANDAGDGAGDKEELLDLDESVAKLYERIQATDNEAFTAYRSYIPLIENTQAIEASDLLKDATTWAKDTDCYGAAGMSGKVFTWLATESKTALSGKMVFQVLDTLKSDAQYTTNNGYKAIVDALQTAYTSLSATQNTQMKAVLKLGNVDSMNLKEMVDTTKASTNYGKYVALYDATAFLKQALKDGAVDIDALNTLYTEADLMVKYSAMANAAKAIDASAVAGLATSTLPTTSVGGDDKKPEVPDTGIIGLIESGAIDLGMVTLIASVAVAGLAGAALIAKLYLKHKF